ncbi:MAG TPA: hypothetical protein VF170_08340, partial [Planctomycetaceae bacterium]
LTGRRLFRDATVAEAAVRRRAEDLRSFRALLPDAGPTVAGIFEASLRRDPRDRRLDLPRLAGFAAPVAPSELAA